MAASKGNESTSSSDSDDSGDSGSSDGNEIRVSSWTYICKAFSDILNSGERINVEYVFESAKKAVLNEEPVHSLKLFAMGLKQICDESCHSTHTTKAIQKEPSSTLAQETYENMCCHLVERWHFSMLNDVSRNQAYQKALTTAIQKCTLKPVVCDVGCGTSLLSLIAIGQNSCRQVFAIEKSSVMCMVAHDVLTANLNPELIQRVKIINKMSTAMSVPGDMNQRADILVTETFDAGLFGEGILPTLCHAWSNLLKNDDSSKGLVIPSRAELFIQVVECDYICKENRSVGMCDTEPYTTQDLKMLPGGYRLLSKPLKFMEVDFNNPKELLKLNKGITQKLSITITEDGRLDALAVWFTLHLNDSVHICTHTSSNSCWEQAIFPVHAIKIQEQPDSRCKEALLNVEKDDIVHVLQCVKGGKFCLDVTSVSNFKENVNQSCHSMRNSVPKFLTGVTEWLKYKVFCLSSGDIAYLNNTDLHSVLINQIQELKKRNTEDNMDFVHLNYGFSSLCLVALQAGYKHSSTIAHNQCHQLLLKVISTYNSIDISGLSLMDDIDGFVSLLENSDSTDVTQTVTGASEDLRSQESHNPEKKSVVVLCDVVDNQGRIVENLSDQLNLLRYCLSDYSVYQVIPHCVDVYGVIIESQDLVCLSRILSDENTLGYKIGQFFNKFSTRNYQGIMLSTLSHKKLTQPFKIFKVDMNKIFHVRKNFSQQFSMTPSQKDSNVNSGSIIEENVISICGKCNLNRLCNSVTDANINGHYESSIETVETMDPKLSHVSHDVSVSGKTNGITQNANMPHCHQCSKVLSSFTHGHSSACQSDSEHRTLSISPLSAEHTDDSCRITQPNWCTDCTKSQLNSTSLPNSTGLTEGHVLTFKPTRESLSEHLTGTFLTSNCVNESEAIHLGTLSDVKSKKLGGRIEQCCSFEEAKYSGTDRLRNDDEDTSEMEQTQNLQIPVIQSGNVTGLVYWFELHISPTVHINTLNFPHHWQQAAVMLTDSPLVIQGDILDMHFKLGNSALSFNFNTK
ncbi:hypothetical protein Btru_077925 [Bulinus truncatus]|nr:hypothetical protein Btru_077925 [Bulinus truncatus]